MRRAGCVALLAWLQACSDPDAPPKAPSFPAAYDASYVEVRSCRKSADHELEFVRILADPAARGPYTNRAGVFPEGAVLLKEQYEAGDDSCSGPITQWTVMVKEQSASDRLGWNWQRVAADRRVVETNADSCFGCHQGCSGAPTGYHFTCADP